MTDVHRMFRLMNKADGKAARHIGLKYDVYRLSNTSSGSILAPANKVISNLKFRMVLDTNGWTIEQSRIYDMIYAGLGNANKLQIGDVLVETDGDGEMFTLAQTRPLSAKVFARTEQACTLTRPAGKQVGGNTSPPAQGRVGMMALGKQTEWLLALNAGFYDFAPTGTPATVPCGIQPYKRLGGLQSFKDAPSMTHRNEVFIYCPILPGVEIQPGDMFSAANGERYRVQTMMPFTEAMQGYLIIGESTFI